MTCYHPMVGYYSPGGGITFQRNGSITGVGFRLPCGQCIGCRLEKARQWAVRCVHEAKLHDFNSFVTLTYSDEFLPAFGTLVKRDLQLFMKRLRKERGEGIRFYGCGEYGDVNQRPHYHVLLFGCDFPDRVRYALNGRGEELCTSADLAARWGKGHCSVGAVTYESCAYVARYCMKKVTGRASDDAYTVVDGDGVLYRREPEFAVMSRRMGIGHGYYEKYGNEVRDHDNVIVDRRPVRAPRFYDGRSESVLGVDRFHGIKLKRKRAGFAAKADNTPERLSVRERVVELNMKRLERKL